MDSTSPRPPSQEFYQLAVDRPTAFARLDVLASDELIRRLEERPEDFPDVTLSQLWKEIQRAKIAIQKPAEMERREKTQNVLVVINGVPVERRPSLLAEAYRMAPLESTKDALVELVGADEAERLLAVEVQAIEVGGA